MATKWFLGWRAFLYKWFVVGKFRPLGKALYNLIVAIELGTLRILDDLSRGELSEPSMLQHITAVIKTHERQNVLLRLIKSIRRLYPNLQIIVIDDGRHPVEFDGVETVVLPFDSGVSLGRNAGLRRVKTRYFLLLDDDFVLYQHTNLPEAVRLMEEHPQIDIMGGEVINLPFFTKITYHNAELYPTESRSTMPPGSYIGGLPVYDKVANFFIGRTNRVRLVRWDPQLKRMDHADFFTRAKGLLTTVFNPEMRCVHAKTPFDQAYLARRRDTALDQAVLWNRYYRD